jgi:hypothetical protein
MNVNAATGGILCSHGGVVKHSARNCRPKFAEAEKFDVQFLQRLFEPTPKKYPK